MNDRAVIHERHGAFTCISTFRACGIDRKELGCRVDGVPAARYQYNDEAAIVWLVLAGVLLMLHFHGVEFCPPTRHSCQADSGLASIHVSKIFENDFLGEGMGLS